MSQPTIEDVARLTGLSSSTVSRALRGLSSVKPATAKKVREAANQLGYSMSRAASSLASGRSMRVVILFPWRVNTWFNSNVFEGVRTVLSDAGYDVIPAVSTSPQKLDSIISDLPTGRDIDAMAVVSFSLTQAQRDTISQLNFPVVGINVPETDGFSGTVCIDDLQAVASGVRALHSLGHNRITFVEQPLPYVLPYSVSTRGKGFIAACQELGLPEDNYQVIHASIDNGVHDFAPVAHDVVNQMLSSATLPTALMGETDEIAIQLVRAFSDLGYNVPNDFSVMGFDNDDVANVLGLSTIQQKPEQLGSEAGSMLLNLLNGEEPPERNVISPTKVLLRSTTRRIRLEQG